MRLRFTLPACLAVPLTLAACGNAGDPAEPTPAVSTAEARAPAGDRLATVEWDGGTPMLFLQRADGSDRVRVHFSHVSDHVTGNYSPASSR